MATIRKNGKKWVAEVRTKGAYRSKTLATKQEAQKWALDLEHQLGKHPGLALSYATRDAFKRYAREVSPSKKGARWEMLRLEKLCRDPLADIMLSDLKREDIQAWIARQTVSDASINRELNIIAAVLREARVQWKWMIDNPMLDIKRPKQPPHRDRLISDKELQKVLLALEYEENAPVKTMRQEIAVAFLLALETAMRQGELWSLDWARVYLDRQFVTLPETKNGTRRDVALSVRAVELLKKLSPRKSGAVLKCAQATAGTVFRRAVELAELENLTFHDSRHSAITCLANKKDPKTGERALNILDLARMVGHRDLRSLQIYYNATAEDIAARLG